jgi:hypothetical protein
LRPGYVLAGAAHTLKFNAIDHGTVAVGSTAATVAGFVSVSLFGCYTLVVIVSISTKVPDAARVAVVVEEVTPSIA